MKRVNINEITGHEVLAKDIISDTGMTLMITGTVIKKGYVHKLKCLGVNYVYIQDNSDCKLLISDTMEQQIKEQCQERVKEVIELYASYGIEQLTPIVSIADCIINDVLEEPEVIYNVCGIRERSEGVFAHCVNVCAMSVLIALRMKLPTEKIKEIAIGCLLHDIGWTHYENGKDDDVAAGAEDSSEYKKHVIYGYSIVNAESWVSSLAKEIVLSHHERLDGSGYPFGIDGKKIKKAVRIVSVCDTFDRMIYGVEGKKYKVYEAIDYIVSQADILFDIAVVKVFLDTVAAYPNGCIVTTNRGDRAIVLRQNRKCPTRPVIQKIEDKNGISYLDNEEIDLTQDLTLFIVDAET